MARPKKVIVYFENSPNAKKQLDILKTLYGSKTEEEILVEATALLFEKEKTNIEQMIQNM